MHTLNELTTDGASEASKYISERDFRNLLHILDFCVKHDYFPSPSHIKELTNELLIDFEHNAFKFKQESQDLFISLAQKIYRNDIRKLEKTAEIAIKYIKSDST